MNFKRLELFGFKSFADKTVIEFNKGITGIVGPNGCGKSNVADSVRWVLGEQSSKLLRGTSMQDVIFSGTEKRKRSSYCEVSLVLDNSDKTVDIDYSEVILTRKLYRSGESEYLINKNPARLKDIVDILHDSGIGRDGYSIIGQGKVEEIVSSKPEKRRGIFEEAAGIAKFKEKKKESENKLQRVRDNLSRVNDIIFEIERQLNPLREQAEVAKKYLQLKENLKVLEVNNYIYNYDSAATKKQDINIKIQGLAQEIALRQNDLQVATDNYNKNFEDIQKIDERIQKLYEQMVNLKVSLEKKSGEANIAREKLAILKEQAQRYNQELLKNQNILTNIENEIIEKTNKQKTNKDKITGLTNEANEVSQKYLSVVDELTKSEDEAEENQQLMISALDKLSDIKADISKLNAEKLASLERQAGLETDKQNTSAKIAFNTENINANNTKLNECNQNKAKYEAELNVFNTNIAKCNQFIEMANENNSQLSQTISSLDARKKVLEEMQKSYDGFNGAVKQVLLASQKNQQLAKKIVGVVANLMKVPSKFETAIEMALGNQVQNIVTENENDAKAIIDYLKQNNYGRATFLPKTSLKPKDLYSYRVDINSCKGSYGVASELIEYDESLSSIFKSLLGGTVIVEDTDTAIKLAKQTRYAFKIVTLDGDVFNPQGSITGGSKKYTVSSIVGREREVEEISEKIKVATEKQTHILGEIEKAKAKLSSSIASQEQKTQQIYENNIQIAKLTEIVNNLITDNENMSQKLNEIESQLEEVKIKIKAIDLALEQTDKEQNSINSNKSNANESIAKRQEKFENLKRERDSYNNTILEVKVEIAKLNSENDAISQDFVRLNEQKEQTLSIIETVSQDIASNQKTIDSAEAIINAKLKDKGYVEISNKLDEVNNQLANLGNYKNELQDGLKIFEEDKLSLNNKLNKLQDKKYQEEFNLSKIDTDIENMQEKIWENYELTYSSALEYKKEDYDLDFGMKEANKVKREIDRLGFVNVNAIDAVSEQEERYKTLKTEYDDGVKAEQDLLQIIKELANEMTTRFDTAFKSIQSNFTKIFKELFGGGNAELVLTEPESGDYLESGVDIIAEPPGKKLQNITLLSGGEKALTAIAILFSILKLRPMPFVILDEIEAALDEANVGRFAKYLKRFSNETQFIVITHRKPTMELADSLHGVTMQEKGVSKTVSVKLADAVENATIGADK